MTTTVICEECGKVYHIPQEQLDKIAGDTAKTKCKNCGHVMEIKKPSTGLEETKKNDDNIASEDIEASLISMGKEEAPSASGPQRNNTYKSEGFAISGLGIRGNMLILFMLIPLVLIAGLGFFSQMQLNTLSRMISGIGKNAANQLAENSITNIAQIIATSCRVYLDQHPELTKEQFNADNHFREITLQKVGKTGYTQLIEVPAMKTGAYISWINPVEQRIGKDITPGINRLSGQQAAMIWEIYHAAIGRNEAKGYYPWADQKGRLRDQFMFMQRVEGTPYFIVARTFIDEFTQPIVELETKAQGMTFKARNVGLGILLATILIIGILVSLYGKRLSSNLTHLAEVADRISIGELDAKVGIKSTDEIGRLAESISKMQDSLNLSIQRLRRRR